MCMLWLFCIRKNVFFSLLLPHFEWQAVAVLFVFLWYLITSQVSVSLWPVSLVSRCCCYEAGTCWHSRVCCYTEYCSINGHTRSGLSSWRCNYGDPWEAAEFWDESGSQPSVGRRDVCTWKALGCQTGSPEPHCAVLTPQLCVLTVTWQLHNS